MFSRFRSLVLLVAAAIVSNARPASGQEGGAKPSPSLPELSAGTSVTIPYAELKALWTAAAQRNAENTATAKPVAPPVVYSLQSARYTVTLGPAAIAGDDVNSGREPVAQVRASFEVLGFAEGWTVVPLLAASEVRLSGAEVEGGSGTVAVRDDAYALLLEGPGRRVVTLRFSVKLTPAVGTGSTIVRRPTLRLTTPPASVNELSIVDVPAGWLPEVENGSRLDTPRAENAAGPVATFHLAAGQPLALALLRVEERKTLVPPTPSVWHRAEAQALVRYDEGRLLYKTRLRVTADAGAGTSAAFTLPVAAQVLAVAGDDLARWQAGKSEPGEGDGAGRRQVQVFWKTADILRREIFVTYELPQPVADGEWRLVTPRTETETGKEPGTLYVLPTIAGLDFLGPDGKPLPEGDARTLLSRWLSEAVGCETFSPLVAGSSSRSEKGEGEVLVGVRRLPLLRAAQATVEEARFHTRLVADGALLSEGKFSVRHDGSLTLNVTLPEGSQLLACTVNGRETAPVDRGGGKVEIALAACASGVGARNAGAGKGGTQIAFAYTSRGRPLAPVSGQVALALPQTDLFVQTLWWDLQIPAAYELTALEGNAELLPSPAAASADSAPVIHLRKELLKAERPSVELFYQKRSATP